MSTLREFIAGNKLSTEQIDALRKLCKGLAEGRARNSGNELPSSLERTLSDGMNKYFHHQDFLCFVARRCEGCLDQTMTEEDLRQLSGIGANLFELRAFL